MICGLYKWNRNIPSVDKLAAVALELNKPIEYFLDAEEVKV